MRIIPKSSLFLIKSPTYEIPVVSSATPLVSCKSLGCGRGCGSGHGPEGELDQVGYQLLN